MTTSEEDILHNSIDSEEIREKFRGFRSLLDGLSMEAEDTLFAVACDLCIEHEVLAFSHGIVVGMHLMSELSGLP